MEEEEEMKERESHFKTGKKEKKEKGMQRKREEE